jgi:hypothetical protein
MPGSSQPSSSDANAQPVAAARVTRDDAPNTVMNTAADAAVKVGCAHVVSYE